MRFRTLLVIVMAGIACAFFIINWQIFATSAKFSLIFTSFETPVGVAMFGVFAILILTLLVYAGIRRSSLLLEYRRLAKELQSQRALADNAEAEVEYAIALYNGTGTLKNQPAAVALLRKAAKQNNPLAQNRLAWVLSTPQGPLEDRIEGLKWHIVAKTAGKGDPMLDDAFTNLSAADRAKAEAGARRWLGTK